MKAWKKIVDVSIAYPQFPSISLIELTYAILDLPPPLRRCTKKDVRSSCKAGTSAVLLTLRWKSRNGPVDRSTRRVPLLPEVER